MTIDPSKPHLTVVLDYEMGESASLSEAPNGELYCNMHPSAAEDGSPAQHSGRAVFQRAVEILIGRQRPGTEGQSVN